jgi:hypothetical protein
MVTLLEWILMRSIQKCKNYSPTVVIQRIRTIIDLTLNVII